jgi:enoyl-CoA hydratase/carnithine racemase
MQTIRYDLDDDGIGTVTFDEPGSSVNTMCLAWQDDMVELAARVVEDAPRLKGIVLASAKPSFFAGADLKLLMRSSERDATEAFGRIERIKQTFRRLETLGTPIVACLNGAALGGGWEVALIAHHRIAVDEPRARFGLPEVTLGLIPGGTGITKMTRLLGLMGAQPYLLEGKTFGAREAQRLGLVHELVADVVAEVEAVSELTVDPVVVGDAPLDEGLTALGAATREALVNAAKHSGATSADLYTEVTPQRVAVFVRDRGAGFDPAAVPADRFGVRHSIEDRMRRHGGTAEVRSAPGEGTEVRLRLPATRAADPEGTPA